MGYRMQRLADGVYAGVMSNGDLNIEVWSRPKPNHATAGDYSEFCEELVIPSEAVEQLFELLR